MGDLNSASRAASVAQWVEYMSRMECHGVTYHFRQLGRSISVVSCCFVLHVCTLTQMMLTSSMYMYMCIHVYM